MRFPSAMVDEMVQHAREAAPDECCGVIATEQGSPVKLFRAVNSEASPVRFVIDSKDQLRISQEIEDSGWDLGIIYHSHTRSAAFPSQTDVNFAAAWPGVVWLIISLQHADSPDLRAFEIDRGEIREVELVVESA